MLSVMLDTNVCIRALRNRPDYIRNRMVSEASTLGISTIVLYELYVGVERSNDPSGQREVVDDFLKRLEILPFNHLAAANAANIRVELSRAGMVIGNSDLLIAGHARSLSLKLITGNLREFRRVDGLRCEDWTDE